MYNKTLDNPTINNLKINNKIITLLDNNINLIDTDSDLINNISEQDLYNKKLFEPIIDKIQTSNNKKILLPDTIDDTLVTLEANQDLNNKTLTNPTIKNPIIKGNLNIENNLTILGVSNLTTLNLDSIYINNYGDIQSIINNLPSYSKINTYYNNNIFNKKITFKDNIICGNNIEITTEQLSYLSNTTSDIQNQINNINNITELQNNFSNINTFSNTLIINSNIITNTETITNNNLSFLSGVTSNIQDQFNNKQNNITSTSNLNVNSILLPNGDVQTQLNNKQNLLNNNSIITLNKLFLQHGDVQLQINTKQNKLNSNDTITIKNLVIENGDVQTQLNNKLDLNTDNILLGKTTCNNDIEIKNNIITNNNNIISNNKLEYLYNLGEWYEYFPTITCNNTNPILPDQHIFKCFYSIIGKTMNIQFSYHSTNNLNSTSGDGLYLISIPDNFFINNNLYSYDVNIFNKNCSTTDNGLNDGDLSIAEQNIIGNGFISMGNYKSKIYISPVYNTNKLCLFTKNRKYLNNLTENYNTYINSNYYNLNTINTPYIIKFSISFSIL